MGCFSQKGLSYSFEILQGLLNKKNIKIPMKMIFGGSALYPQLTLFWPENGEIWWNRLCRYACRKISTSADGGLSRGSRVRGHGSEDPHRRLRKFFRLKLMCLGLVEFCSFQLVFIFVKHETVSISLKSVSKWNYSFPKNYFNDEDDS